MNSKAKLASNVVSITDKQPSRKQLNKRVERQLQKVFDKAGSTWNGSTAARGGATGCPKKPLRHWAEEAETECERNPSNDDAFIKTTAVRAAMDLEKAGLLPAECGHRWNIPLSLVYEGYRAALKKMAGFDPSKGTRKQFVYKTARGTIQNLAWELYGPTGKRKHTKDQALPKLVGFSVDIPEHRWGLDHGNAGYQVKPRNGDDNDDEGGGGNVIAPSNLDTSISEIETKITLNQLALSASLSTMDMDILRKKHIEGFTMRELANEYGKSEKAIESQLNRIITMLRAEAHKEDSQFADQPPFLSK